MKWYKKNKVSFLLQFFFTFTIIQSSSLTYLVYL